MSYQSLILTIYQHTNAGNPADPNIGFWVCAQPNAAGGKPTSMAAATGCLGHFLKEEACVVGAMAIQYLGCFDSDFVADWPVMRKLSTSPSTESSDEKASDGLAEAHLIPDQAP